MSKNKFGWRLLTMGMVGCLAAILFLTSTPSAHATASAPQVSLAGGINVGAYCRRLGYPSVTTVGSTAYDWRCTNANGALFAPNMVDACILQYGNVNTEARAYNFYQITSWQCFHFSTVLGGINLGAYCQSLGDVGITTVGTTVYDWRCVSAWGSLQGFSMSNACQWQYPGPFVIDDFTNFYDMTSIYCLT